jgi:hypothetical protein
MDRLNCILVPWLGTCEMVSRGGRLLWTLVGDEGGVDRLLRLLVLTWNVEGEDPVLFRNVWREDFFVFS